MSEWPVTVALTDAEAEALEDLADAEHGGDRDEAIESVLESWLRDRGRGSSRFKYE